MCHINKDTKFWGWLGHISLFPDAPQPSAAETTCLGFPGRRKARQKSSCSTGIPSSGRYLPKCPWVSRATRHTQLGYTVPVQQQEQWIQALPPFCQHLSQHVRMSMKNSCSLDGVTSKHSNIIPGSRIFPKLGTTSFWEEQNLLSSFLCRRDKVIIWNFHFARQLGRSIITLLSFVPENTKCEHSELRTL